MQDTSILFLEPVCKDKLWGGHKLAEEWGYTIPSETTGECWAISAMPTGDCTVSEGRFAGMKLSEVYATHREIFGDCQEETFPLLIKIIDAQKDLSVQVHPDDAYACEHEHGARGKRECWYILDCDPHTQIIVGQKAHTREEFLTAVENGAWDQVLNTIPVHPGDFFQIDPGVVHAIKGGTLILETQQASDITYRVYDYDRTDASGKKRELHLKESLETIDYHHELPQARQMFVHRDEYLEELVSCASYTVCRLCVSTAYTFKHNAPFVCVSVIRGEGSVNGHPVAKGSHFIIPAQLTHVTFSGDMQLILSSTKL